MYIELFSLDLSPVKISATVDVLNNHTCDSARISGLSLRANFRPFRFRFGDPFQEIGTVQTLAYSILLVTFEWTWRERSKNSSAVGDTLEEISVLAR